MLLDLSFGMDTSVMMKKEPVFVKVEPVSSEGSSGVPEMIPDIGNMKIEDTENLMDNSFERSNLVIKEEIGNYYSVTENVHDIKTLGEDGNEDVKIETKDEALEDTLQESCTTN
ncbi:uncharacterized protein [Anabrus simplex]|uniref:uncharacterized protein n=1 Tax=Anabrus simplex TaxID=316456 RepID=UPI0035A377BD